MAEKKSYYEQLKDTRWQRKRLEIMERADFLCQWCHAGEGATLNVHHTHYDKGAAPWEYPSESLLCLCEDCHKKAHVMWEEMNKLVSRLATTVYGSELETVIGYAKSALADYERCYDRVDDFEFTESQALGVSHFFGIRPDLVFSSEHKTTATRMWDLARARGYRFRATWERIINGGAV